MHEYKVTGPVANINQGLLLLDDNQLRRRRAAVEVIEPGDLELGEGEHMCRIVSPVQFKQGETFFTDQAIDKLQAQALEQTDSFIDYEDPEVEEPDKEPDPDADADPDLDEPYNYEDWHSDMLNAELVKREISFHQNTGDRKKRGYLMDDDAAAQADADA